LTATAPFLPPLPPFHLDIQNYYVLYCGRRKAIPYHIYKHTPGDFHARIVEEKEVGSSQQEGYKVSYFYIIAVMVNHLSRMHN